MTIVRVVWKGESRGMRLLRSARGYRLKSSPNHLGDVGGLEKGYRHEDPGDPRGAQFERQEEAESEHPEKQEGYERHSSDQFDVCDRDAS